MLRSLWLLFVYTSFLGLSVNAPFVATLGYVWVDTFQPQNVAYIILNQFPVALIMGSVAFGGYLLLDRRSPPISDAADRAAGDHGDLGHAYADLGAGS